MNISLPWIKWIWWRRLRHRGTGVDMSKAEDFEMTRREFVVAGAASALTLKSDAQTVLTGNHLPEVSVTLDVNRKCETLRQDIRVRNYAIALDKFPDQLPQIDLAQLGGGRGSSAI
jgi:hypothetical protein